MADFSKPSTASTKTSFPTEITGNDAVLATMFEADATALNKPTNAKRIDVGGIVYNWNGASWVSIGSVASAFTELTGSGNYSVPSGATKLEVIAFSGGAGGGGGQDSDSPSNGGNGGSGGRAGSVRHWTQTVTGGASLAYSCGAGGAGGAGQIAGGANPSDGADGAVSTFDSVSTQQSTGGRGAQTADTSVPDTTHGEFGTFPGAGGVRPAVGGDSIPKYTGGYSDLASGGGRIGVSTDGGGGGAGGSVAVPVGHEFSYGGGDGGYAGGQGLVGGDGVAGDLASGGGGGAGAGADAVGKDGGAGGAGGAGFILVRVI